MQAGNKWTELLTCPACGQSGIVYLSQPEGRVYDFSASESPQLVTACAIPSWRRIGSRTSGAKASGLTGALSYICMILTP